MLVTDAQIKELQLQLKIAEKRDVELQQLRVMY